MCSVAVAVAAAEAAVAVAAAVEAVVAVFGTGCKGLATPTNLANALPTWCFTVPCLVPCGAVTR